MLFNSYMFILLFLPLTAAGYFALNRFGKYHWSNIFLIGMSLWFYGCFNPSYLPIICGSILANYLLSRLLIKPEMKNRRLLLAVGVVMNAALIFVFKYYDFFVKNINALFRSDLALKHIALPLGISFFTFQQISYIVDSYRGETSDYSFDEYALFVSFFPQLVAGPIVLHSELIPQFRDPERRSFSIDSFGRGLFIFAFGLFKKVIIADTLGKYADYGFGMIDVFNSTEAFSTSLAYTFQLFFDFTGYCDMAIGIGAMLNLDIPQNFNSPYRAASIVEFWNRWHMSLTRFLRTYIYFPLGGSRRGTGRTYLNIMIVFAVSGLWHGADWTFVVWGLLHGLLNCFDRWAKPLLDKIWKPVRWLFTFMAVNTLWVIFRANTLSDAFEFIKKMFSFTGRGIDAGYFEAITPQKLIYLGRLFTPVVEILSRCPGLFFWGLIVLLFIAVFTVKNTAKIKFRPTVFSSLLTVVMFMWPLINLAHKTVFLYFDF